MAAVIFPWPTRAERKEQVQDARREAEVSRRGAEHARSLSAELRALRRRNHVQEALADLIQRRAEGKQ